LDSDRNKVIAPKHHPREAERLKDLERLGIIDSSAERAFNDLARLAAYICDTPISAISLVDEKRQWFKADIGLGLTETHRDVSFCGHSILSSEVLVVEDSTQDPRFHDNPLVQAGPKIRFYAGAPIFSDRGYPLGAICAIDTKPRKLSIGQIEALQRLASQVWDQIRLRLELREREEQISQNQHQQKVIQSFFDAAPVLMGVLAVKDRKIVHSTENRASKTFFNWPSLNETNTAVLQAWLGQFDKAKRLNRPVEFDYMHRLGSDELRSIRAVVTCLGLDPMHGHDLFSFVAEDQTGKQSLQDSLDRERERFQAAIEGADAGLWDWDTRTNSVYFSTRWKSMLGYSEDEISPDFESWRKLVHPDDLKNALETIDECFKGRTKSYSLEHRLRCRNGEYRWILAKGMCVRDEDSGDVVRLTGWHIDIHERRLADERMRESETLFRSIANTAAVFFWLSDGQGSCTFLSQPWLEFTGQSLVQGLGDGWADVIHPEDAEAAVREFKEAVAARRSCTLQYRLRHKSGEYRWVVDQSRPRFDSNGEFAGYVGACTDITEIKRIEAQLRESRNFLDTVLNNLPVGIFCKDVDQGYAFTLWNRSSEEMFGLKSKDVIGRRDTDFFSREQANAFRERDEQVMESQTRFEIAEEPISTPHRGERWLRTVKVPIFDGDGRPKYLLGISEDITEKKQQQKLIEDQQVKIIASAKMSSLGEMAGGIAHEINNPLAIIHGRTAQLQEMLRQPSPDLELIKTGLHRIHVTTERIAKIVRGLRSFSRSGENDPFISTPVKQIIEDTLELCRERFRSRSIDLRQRVSFESLTSIECRSVQISQVLLNLLNNACDAIANLPEKWVEVSMDVATDHVVISIRDSGRGIPEEVARRMMDPFFSTKDIGQGTGLGLSISNGIVEEHGGVLEYDRRSENTCFHVILPMRQYARIAG